MRAPIALAAVAAAALPAPALAHAAERGTLMLLPTGHYLAAGAAAVGLSFAVLTLVPPRVVLRAFGSRTLLRRRASGCGPVLSLGAMLVFLLLVLAGFAGSRDPLANPLPLTVWTVWWIGLTLASAALGDLWRSLNPWSGAMSLLRRAGLRPIARLPGRVGTWPAILWLAGFGWFALVDPAPDDPARLAVAALVYWAATLAAMLLFGEAAWRRRGECFAIFFALVARLAPVRSRPAGARGRAVETRAMLPGADAATGPALAPTGALFLLLALAIVTFDGFRETFWWLGRIGVNPLAFPGRSALVAENTLGLGLAWAALAGSFAAAVAAGLALAGARGRFRESFGRLALSLVPIALAYHLSHYLTKVMVYGQHLAVIATDPLGTGADLLGLGAHYVTTSFLFRHEAVETIWQVQSGTIVAGHVIAVAVARRIALGLHAAPRQATLAELPLAILMVGYTLLGLWLLSTPVA